MNYFAYDIEWDTDGADVELDTEVEVEADTKDDVVDILSNEYEFCIESLRIAEIKYYEVEFGKGVDNDRICIRGIRKPTIREVSRFCRKDEKIFGKKVTAVVEISHKDAEEFYDMANEKDFPIFR